MFGGSDADTNQIPRRLVLKKMILDNALENEIIDQERYNELVNQLPGKPKLTPDEIHEIKKNHTPINKNLMADLAPTILLSEKPTGAITTQIPDSVKVQNRKAPTHLPPANIEMLKLELTERNKLAIDKEKYIKKIGWTEQFDDSKPFISLFPHHSNSDSATYWWSVRERLNFMSPTRNDKKIKDSKTKILGSMLYEAFCEATDENARKRLTKPLATLMNITERGETWWKDNFADIFLKSQILKKPEKNVKASIEKNKNKHNIFILGEKSFDELNDFVIENWKMRESFANDYTKFDQSQNHEFLNFEDLLHAHFNIPDVLRRYYMWLKMNTETQHGNLEVMRITGGTETYDYNSFGNIAFTHLEWKIPLGTAQLFSGDDSAINCVPKMRPAFVDIQNSFTLQGKPEYGKRPTFCGWFITSDGIIKHPTIILARIEIAKERHNEENVFVSYAIEAHYAFKMGELQFEHLSDDEILTQSALIEYFRKNAHKYDLPTNVNFFESYEEAIKIGCSPHGQHNDHDPFQSGRCYFHLMDEDECYDPLFFNRPYLTTSMINKLLTKTFSKD
ncbi:4344_t:CDS:2, partial [Racocetra persica]